MRWFKFPSARLIFGSAMKRPAGQPVRSSGELHAWVITLQAQAVDAAERLSAFCEREISCEYLGQRTGSGHRIVYQKHPSEFKIQSGKTRICVAVCFRWTLVGAKDLEPVLTEQENKDARRRGFTRHESLTGLAAVAPCTLWFDRASEALQKAAGDFVGRYGPELLHEFGLQVQCTCAT